LSTDDQPTDDGAAPRMLRDAILRELLAPADADEPPPVNKLQQVARALVSKAAREDVAAIREILDRIDGKASASAASGAAQAAGHGSREVNIRWKDQTSS